jgi:hypothetical protein
MTGYRAAAKRKPTYEELEQRISFLEEKISKQTDENTFTRAGTRSGLSPIQHRLQ